jgi:1-acyl-sn-glycerol-3-phosphate acyltransferase
MDAASDRARRTGPRELSVAVTPRYRFMWGLNRLIIGILFDVRASGLEHMPAPPFQLVANHHNGFDPMLVVSVAPLEPRITWFGPREADFSHGFKNRLLAFFGGVIPYNPEKTTLTSAVRAVRRVFEADGVLGIFAEGRIGFRESELLPFEEGAPTSGSASGSRSASDPPSRPMRSAGVRLAPRSRHGFASPSVRCCPIASRACRDAGRWPSSRTSSTAPRTWRVARAGATSIGA